MENKITNKILEKLNNARNTIRNSNNKKDGHNDYSKYDYFTPEAVEKIVSNVCVQERMICLCNLLRDEHGLYQELKLVDLEGSDMLEFKLATSMGSMKATNEAQQMGGTDTYSERYIKMKVFGIKDNALDPDSQDQRNTKKDTKTIQIDDELDL